jgi:hypothetical protein
MSANPSVTTYVFLCLEIILCLVIGIVLVLLPWVPQGTLWVLSDWGNNYFLVYAAHKTGIHALQTVVASGWMRGAVTGVGLLNIGIAFWEMFHFSQSVQTLQDGTEPPSVRKNAPRPAPRSTPADLSDYQRRDDRPDHTRH